MPPELTAAPFEAAHRPTQSNGASRRKTAGAGLGLSIARGIVQAHEGRIELIPQSKGTRFSVYLPVEAEILDGSLTGPRPATTRSVLAELAASIEHGGSTE